MGNDDFLKGARNDPLAKYELRDVASELEYQRGRRAGGHGGGTWRAPVGTIQDLAPWAKASAVCALFGLVGGFGFGVWQILTDSRSPGLGADAVSVLKWIGLGVVGGALVPWALVAAAGLALLGGILWALAWLVDTLAG